MTPQNRAPVIIPIPVQQLDFPPLRARFPGIRRGPGGHNRAAPHRIPIRPLSPRQMPRSEMGLWGGAKPKLISPRGFVKVFGCVMAPVSLNAWCCAIRRHFRREPLKPIPAREGARLGAAEKSNGGEQGDAPPCRRFARRKTVPRAGW